MCVSFFTVKGDPPTHLGFYFLFPNCASYIFKCCSYDQFWGNQIWEGHCSLQEKRPTFSKILTGFSSRVSQALWNGAGNLVGSASFELFKISLWSIILWLERCLISQEYLIHKHVYWVQVPAFMKQAVGGSITLILVLWGGGGGGRAGRFLGLVGGPPGYKKQQQKQPNYCKFHVQERNPTQKNKVESDRGGYLTPTSCLHTCAQCAKHTQQQQIMFRNWHWFLFSFLECQENFGCHKSHFLWSALI